jgi:RNA polymerase II subunit A C-terminal domain phosphatase
VVVIPSDDMIEPTPIQLPRSLLYPIEITGILTPSGSKVQKHGAILKYKYWNTVEEGVGEDGDEQGQKVVKEFHSIFESPIEGEIYQWFVKEGDEVDGPSAAVVSVVEPCTHAVQYGGLCAICGEPLDEKDYSEFDNNSRAPITMSHDTSGLKVSYNEAKRIEKTSSERLLADEKLILVVDLDQTVIHAAVDPTIGEWMKDEHNPNYEALKDVQSFSLEEEIPVPPNFEGKPPTTRCWYYVKLRPGLKEFLESINNIYEMHIYTMATKSYAKAIAKIIDPEGKYFGDRILSRDESGSLVQKSLKRLFPVSTSMVAVIDDRGDVWRWSSSLIKVVPYNFFVGIGDINSSFLPQRGGVISPSRLQDSADGDRPEMSKESTLGNENKEPDESETKELALSNGVRGEDENDLEGHRQRGLDTDEVMPDNENVVPVNEDEEGEPIDTEVASKENDPDGSVDTVEQLVEMGGEDNPDLLNAQVSQRSASIEQQQLERPLAKLQKELESKADPSVKHGEAHLLSDNDKELQSVEMALRMIHRAFYDEYAQIQVSDGAADQRQQQLSPDLAQIIPSLKHQVFKDCVILFSGVLPLGTNLETADIVQWIRGFGAKVVDDLTPEVTHVVAIWNRTAKVRRAATVPRIKIVYRDWLFACLTAWKRVPEDPYLIDVERPIAQEDDTRTAAGLGKETATDPLDPQEFMKSLSGGEVDWDEVNKEVDEFMNSDEEEEDDDGDEDEDEEAEEEGVDENDGNELDDLGNEDYEENDGNSNGSLKRSRETADDRRPGSKRPKPTDENEKVSDSDNSWDDNDQFLRELENDLM